MIAVKAADRISEIFHLDNQLDDLTKAERKRQRRTVIKPKVDAFFTWAKSSIAKVPANGATAKALQYCINQEQFLRVFLNDANVPMDNNRAEQAANVKQNFTSLGNDFFTLYGKQIFTSSGKEFFTRVGKQFFT